MLGKEPFVGWVANKLLGQGAFGKVYCVEKERFRSAVKQIIIPDKTTYGNDIERFRGDKQKILEFYRPKAEKMKNEILIMQSLNGMNGAVTYHDHTMREYEEYSAWEILIRMEYLTPIVEYINENGIETRQILKMGIDLCSILEVCRKKKILHRDIKKSNILVNVQGDFKLGDFGMAKNMEGISHASSIAGTRGYMAPEVEERDKKYDHRADIYSLGIVIYELLNENNMPFMRKGGTITELEQSRRALRRGDSIPEPEHGGRAIFEAVKKACEYNVKKRYTTFEEMGKALENLLKKTEDKILDTYAISGKETQVGDGIETVPANEPINGVKYVDLNEGSIISDILKRMFSIDKDKELPKKERRESRKRKYKKIAVLASVVLLVGVLIALIYGNFTNVIEPSPKPTNGAIVKPTPTSYEPKDFVKINAGTFSMGSPSTEPDRDNDETQHQVKVDNFYMSKYEVTIAKFKNFVDETKYQTDADKNGGSNILDGEKWVFTKNTNWRCDVNGIVQSNENHPAIYVSWNDANEYCKWLSKKINKSVRLPTEAEWEYACRAETTTPFSTGENLTTDQANYNGHNPYNGNHEGDFVSKITLVGSYTPNKWDLYNMHGNAYEWCSDWYSSNYYDECKKQGVLENPKGAKKGEYHVLRGGSWRSMGKSCRSADRPSEPSKNMSYVSFRPVLLD